MLPPPIFSLPLLSVFTFLPYQVSCHHFCTAPSLPLPISVSHSSTSSIFMLRSTTCICFSHRITSLPISLSLSHSLLSMLFLVLLMLRLVDDSGLRMLMTVVRIARCGILAMVDYTVKPLICLFFCF